MTTRSHRVLGVLADVAGSTNVRKEYRVDPSTMRWMPLSYTKLFRGESGLRGEASGIQDGFPDDALTDRIFKTARLHDDEAILRLGWMWVAGRHPEIGQVLCPLASMPVQKPPLHAARKALNRSLRAVDRSADVLPASELELTELIDDRDDRDRLSDIPHGDSAFSTMASAFVAPLNEHNSQALRQQRAALTSWAIAAADAAGLTTQMVVDAHDGPGEYLASPQRQIVLGLALYVAAPENESHRITTASTLHAWTQRNVEDTAFARLYADADPERSSATSAPERDRIHTSLLLNPAQERVVRSSMHQQLTVVSGPPGTGKSQTVVAAAHHHVSAGRRVLVAAPSDASVSALVALLEATPGPDPIVFGASMKRLDVANRLADGGGPWFDDAALDASRRRDDAAANDLGRQHERIAELLQTELSAAADPSAVLHARQVAPGLFDTDVDLHALVDLARRAADAGGWWSRRRGRRALERLRLAARCDRTMDLAGVEQLLDTAIARQRAATLEAEGGLDLGRSWSQLIAAHDQALHLAGAALEAATHHEDRADRASRRAIGAVAAALRAGRVKRRRALAEVRGRALTDALPLWIATLRDIDDLLPMQSEMFDIVIIDEASHIDQVGAAPALLRAPSAMIVGDPRQLRHVSFLSEDRIVAALERNGLAGTPVASQLDVRNQTLFDAAAAVAPVVTLDEHYRSAPHLISFSAERFYGGRLHVATRHPRNEQEDRIDVLEVKGHRDDNGVNAVEVDEVRKRLRRELRSGSTSVGVLTPFRAQADAIEKAVLESFELSDIEALDLRVGTVHSFQGCQRDVVYISLTLDADSASGSRAFVSESTLFNVMVTRARERIQVVSSMGTSATGVLADYLRHAQLPSRGHHASRPLARWPEVVRAEMEGAGLQMATGYPAGRHEVDLVLGSGEHALAVVCGVHVDGVDAHIARHLDLVRAGWTVTEAFESRWGERTAELAVDLARRSESR